MHIFLDVAKSSFPGGRDVNSLRAVSSPATELSGDRMPTLRQLPGNRAVRQPPISWKTTSFQGFPGTTTGPSTCDAFCWAFMKDQPLQYYMHDGPTAFRFELTGDLSREAARSLDQDWRTASSAIGDRRLNVDITLVTNVDEQGRALITRWHREGARLIANSKASLALAESMLGEPLPEPPVNAAQRPSRIVHGLRSTPHFWYTR
jgi:ABC-type transporter Mla MlaB component